MPGLNSHPLIQRFERSFTLTAAENKTVSAIAMRELAIVAGHDIVREGDRPTRCVIILNGIAGTSNTGEDGKRQTSAFHMPGDMPDLLSLHLDVLDSDIRSVSDCTVGFIDHKAIKLMCERHPRLAASLWRATLVDASIYREWVVNVGIRPALNRVAHLFCETMLRMQAIGQTDNLSCAFKVTQRDLSEATGMSVVHLNRTLQILRKAKLIAVDQVTLTVLNWDGLSELAGFRSDYLHLGRARGQTH